MTNAGAPSAARHNLDVCFADGEKLWRAVEKRDFNANNLGVKGNRLRLQLSVMRSSKCSGPCHPEHGTREQHGFPMAGTGKDLVAVISVREARERFGDHLRTACLSDPAKGLNAHALIAFFSDSAPGSVSHDEVTDARNVIASRMRKGAVFVHACPFAPAAEASRAMEEGALESGAPSATNQTQDGSS